MVVTLKDIYYNLKDPGALGGIEGLYKRARQKGLNVTRAQVKLFLSKQDSYTLHKPIKHQYQRGRVIVGSIDKQWQADLADMNEVSSANDG